MNIPGQTTEFRSLGTVLQDEARARFPSPLNERPGLHWSEIMGLEIKISDEENQ